MDVEIVNRVLRLCVEQQTCLFQVSILCNDCLEQHLCTSSKHVLPSIRNYLELFRISPDQSGIEFLMPFRISPETNTIDADASVQLCYKHFHRQTCPRLNDCPYPHVLGKATHGPVLATLINLDFDLLTDACRVYCQTKENVVDHPWLLRHTPQLNGTVSWKTKRRSVSPLVETGLQISWTPQRNVHSHFIEVVFSNQNKCHGAPIRTHQIYQHFGIAHVFYHNSDIIDRVIRHGPVSFQSFTFIPRLLHRTLDRRRVCWLNLPSDSMSYIERVSVPYTIHRRDYYQEDRNLLIVEYQEDIEFFQISSNVRQRPECNGQMVTCRPVYQPESLLVEHEQDYSAEDLQQWLGEETEVHIKTYPHCSFVHFRSHQDLLRAMESVSDRSIVLTSIYSDLYSPDHFDDYSKRRRTIIENRTTDTPVVALSTDSPHDESPPTSEDDFHDLPSEFDDDDLLFLDEKTDETGDVEFLRSAAKNLMSSLSEMEAANGSADLTDALQSVLYADDYLVKISNRRFLLAFLDYTQFRVEKQRNPDRFRFLASLKRMTEQKKLLSNDETPSTVSTPEVKSTKKKRQKRVKKKKSTNADELGSVTLHLTESKRQVSFL